MFKWLFGWFDHDASSKQEEYMKGGTECPQEPVQVNVEMDMPDFLTKVSAEISVKHVEQDSLLDNQRLVKVFSECADLLNEIDRISPRFKSPDSQLLIEMINERLRSALYLSGGSPIDNDEFFDPIRHVCQENPMAAECTPISEIIQPGVELDTRVFVKAKVRLKSYSNQ